MASTSKGNGGTPPAASPIALVAGRSGLGARLDRGAWAALSQPADGPWSWSRAIVTIVAAMLCAVLIFVTIYREPAFIAALAFVYALLVFRARTIELRYGERQEGP